MWPLTDTQIDAIKRLDKAISMRDGSADECHSYYCPYNVGMLVDHVKRENFRDEKAVFLYGMPPNESCRMDDGILHEEDHGIYHGKPDGFDSECPRFVCIDRATGKWDCLCGLEVVARLLGVGVKALNEELKPYFDEHHEILGYNPTWRKAGGSEWLKDGESG